MQQWEDSCPEVENRGQLRESTLRKEKATRWKTGETRLQDATHPESETKTTDFCDSGILKETQPKLWRITLWNEKDSQAFKITLSLAGT